MVNDEELALLQSQVNDLTDEFRTHVEEEDVRWNHLITMQEQNTTAINSLTVAVTRQAESTDRQAESTKDIVEAWEAANGAVKVGGWIFKFLRWCSGVAVIGVGAAYVLEHLKH